MLKNKHFFKKQIIKLFLNSTSSGCNLSTDLLKFVSTFHIFELALPTQCIFYHFCACLKLTKFFSLCLADNAYQHLPTIHYHFSFSLNVLCVSIMLLFEQLLFWVNHLELVVSKSFHTVTPFSFLLPFQVLDGTYRRPIFTTR